LVFVDRNVKALDKYSGEKRTLQILSLV